ncbi:MAG: hypothetical protein ACK5YK_00315 [Pseudomonadota bacterium]
MPLLNLSDPLAIAALYQHQYDIDTILAALCGTAPVWLNTAEGTISSAEPTHIPSSHRFVLEPLPTTFIGSLSTSPERRLLNDSENAQLDALLKTLTIAGLAPLLETPTRLGGWLRERVKEAALQWLDLHNLIPPSMRHINRRTESLPTPNTKPRVRMVEEL